MIRTRRADAYGELILEVRLGLATCESKGGTVKYPNKLPDGLTLEEVCNAVEAGMFGLDNPGFCLECGAERDGCEPDAEGYECYDCGAMAVAGAENVLVVYA